MFIFNSIVGGDVASVEEGDSPGFGSRRASEWLEARRSREGLAAAAQQSDARAMRLTRIDRLFHSIVVLGAALGGGCSSKVESVDAQGASGSGGDAGSGGAAGAAGEGGAGGSGGAMADAGVVIDDPSDCEFSAQFSCSFGDETVCQCDPNAPKGPEDCEKAPDFHCWEYEPQYVTCKCVPGSPESQEDCEEPTFFYCAYDNPPIGCHCIVPIA